MRSVVISNQPTYRLTSHGNGWAYTLAMRDYLRDEEDWPAVWVQDDDATAFRQRLDSLEAAHPDWSTDYILQELWGEYAHCLA